MRGQHHAPAAVYPRERPDTHCTECWVGPQGLSGQVRKISPLPGFDPRTVQLVASHYTDWATIYGWHPSNNEIILTCECIYIQYFRMCPIRQSNVHFGLNVLVCSHIIAQDRIVNIPGGRFWNTIEYVDDVRAAAYISECKLT